MLTFSPRRGESLDGSRFVCLSRIPEKYQPPARHFALPLAMQRVRRRRITSAYEETV
jgi:hypothetical protein